MTDPAAIFGTDLWLGVNEDGALDIDATMRETSGIQVLAQSLAIRQLNNPGAAIAYPDECINIRSWLSRGMTQAQIQQLAAQVKGQLLRDQRVTGATVQASYNTATSTLTMVEYITTGAGRFTLTLSVSQLTVQLFLNGVPLGVSTK